MNASLILIPGGSLLFKTTKTKSSYLTQISKYTTFLMCTVTAQYEIFSPNVHYIFALIIYLYKAFFSNGYNYIVFTSFGWCHSLKQFTNETVYKWAIETWGLCLRAEQWQLHGDTGILTHLHFRQLVDTLLEEQLTFILFYTAKQLRDNCGSLMVLGFTLTTFQSDSSI